MARPLVFQLGDQLLSLTIHKVDRARLYGFKELEVVDDLGRVCELATLAEDGRTLVGRGSTGLGWVDVDGQWCDRNQLRPVDVEGSEMQPIESSFNGPIKLFETVTIDDYLRHNIRLVYGIESQDDLAELKPHMHRGTIFSFPYSYRGGYEADCGFLLMNEAGDVMLAIGNPTSVNFVGLSTPAIDTLTNEEPHEEDDLMDFDMI